MQRVERSARIGAAPEEVFAYLADLDNLADWQSGVVATEGTSAGEMGVGTTARVTREMMGQRLSVPLTITEFDPPRRLVIGSEVSGVKAVAELDLSEADGGATQLAFAMEIRGSMLTTFMEPMIASAAGGDIEASLEKLRTRIEGGAGE
ncbi:MAG: SRPBCC family protein [Candidatus Limnocylindria bacterium]